MIWSSINIILFVVSVTVGAYAKHIDSSENFEALFLIMVAIAIFVIAVISSSVKYFFF